MEKFENGGVIIHSINYCLDKELYLEITEVK